MGAWFNQLIERIAPHFKRKATKQHAQDYLKGLLSSVERKNGWQIAEHAGDRTPDAIQRGGNGSIVVAMGRTDRECMIGQRLPSIVQLPQSGAAIHLRLVNLATGSSSYRQVLSLQTSSDFSNAGSTTVVLDKWGDGIDVH